MSEYQIVMGWKNIKYSKPNIHPIAGVEKY